MSRDTRYTKWDRVEICTGSKYSTTGFILQQLAKSEMSKGQHHEHVAHVYIRSPSRLEHSRPTAQFMQQSFSQCSHTCSSNMRAGRAQDSQGRLMFNASRSQMEQCSASLLEHTSQCQWPQRVCNPGCEATLIVV